MTRMRLGLAGAMLAAMVAPMTAAKADHCDAPHLVLFTSAAGANPGFHSSVTCSNVGPDEVLNTDYALPGAANWAARWLLADEPANGALLGDGTVTGGHVVFAGRTILLKWTKGSGEFWNSQGFAVTRDESISGKNAVVTSCFKDDPTTCETRTFRTLA